jgi:hypothetical protein
MDGQRVAVARSTRDFEPTEDGTNLTVTVQVVSFVGPDMIHGYESGNKSALHARFHFEEQMTSFRFDDPQTVSTH